MPEALSRPIGPLAVWQWAVVLVGGYIGYRYLSGRSSGSTTSATTTDLSQLGSNIIQGPQGPAGPQGPPGPAGSGGSGGTTAGTLWGSDVPAAIQALDPTGKKTASLFAKYHLSFGSVINMSDLKALFSKEHLSYGSVIEPKDILALFKKAGVPLVATPTAEMPTTPLAAFSIPTAVVAPVRPVSNVINPVSTTKGSQPINQPIILTPTFVGAANNGKLPLPATTIANTPYIDTTAH